MSDDEIKRHLHLVTDSVAQDPSIADPVVAQSDLTPFPDIPDALEEITPEVARQVLKAATEHSEAGQAEVVVEKLKTFPDKGFAARIALNIGEKNADQSLLDLARDLDEEGGEVTQRANAASAMIMLASANPDATTQETAKNIRELGQKKETHSGPRPSFAIASPKEDHEAVAPRIDELDRLEAEIRSAKTHDGRNRAIVAYDRHMLDLVNWAGSAGDLQLADTFVRTAKTHDGRNRAIVAYDRHMLDLVDTVAADGHLVTADHILRSAKTHDGRNRAMVLFDRRVLEHIENAVKHGDFDLAKHLARSLKTHDGASRGRTMIRRAGA